MRLWSLHPSLLDRAALVALWREGLLAQKVLLGKTRGYRFHPQLDRFRAARDPVAAIATYLRAVQREAAKRGYKFNAAKIVAKRVRISLTVTTGQLSFERAHLVSKLRRRDRAALRRLNLCRLEPHPMMRVVRGRIEVWEVI